MEGPRTETTSKNLSFTQIVIASDQKAGTTVKRDMLRSLEKKDMLAEETEGASREAEVLRRCVEW